MRVKSVFLLFVVLLASLVLPSTAMAKDMTINDALWDLDQMNPRCVYEIADDGDRTDAIQYITRTRDIISPGKDLIDAAKYEDKEKLKGGFILFTTIGEVSKLFKAVTQPLKVRIEGNTLHWCGLTVPITNELRIIFVGKNPYGDGYCVVFAAGSNKALVGINSGLPRGACSYHIYEDKKLLKEGNYDENFIILPDCISKAEAVEDVNQYFSTLQRVHPDLLAKVTLDDYVGLRQQTLDGIAEKLDKDGNIAIKDLAYTLHYAAAFFQDGHTCVNWRFQPSESNTQGKRFPSFMLRYDNGRFVISSSKDKDIEGMEIISVNGKPIREFIRPILDRISGETLVWKAERFTESQAYWYAFSNLCDSAESLTLKLRDYGGTEREQKAETVGLADFWKLSANVRITKLDELRRKGTQVHFLDSDRIAWFVYPAFKYSEDEKKKIDGIFQEIKASGSQDLIIDIRDNSGGTSSMGDLIFSYLHEGKLIQVSKTRMKVSSDILSPNYPKMASLVLEADVAQKYSAYLQKKYAGLEGVIVTQDGEDEEDKEYTKIFGDNKNGEPLSKPNAFFSGRIFLLVDNGTFSAGTMLAAAFRDYGVGTILGYETGGVPISFGEMYLFELEDSRLLCGVSYIQQFNPKPRSGDDEHGVIPDIPMTAELLRPYQNEDDPVLAYTLDHVKKTRQDP